MTVLIAIIAVAMVIYQMVYTQIILQDVGLHTNTHLALALMLVFGAPGKFGPKQKEPWSVNASTMLWSADVEMPNEVTYEICRIIYEHYKEFGKYHITGKAISPETMSKSESSDPKFVHPGALKFYKEKGLKLGPIKLD